MICSEASSADGSWAASALFMMITEKVILVGLSSVCQLVVDLILL